MFKKFLTLWDSDRNNDGAKSKYIHSKVRNHSLYLYLKNSNRK